MKKEKKEKFKIKKTEKAWLNIKNEKERKKERKKFRNK
jgi:hypothetical protein